ncbi:MAG: cobalt transporter CbiM [Planctomycetota bacterium]
MHIQDGVFPPTPTGIAVMGGAGVIAFAGAMIGIKHLDDERIPHVAVVSCAFFVASLIHLPIGPTSVHLIMNGLAGVLLGWCSFPALLIALSLQLLFFGFGGVTTLGINTVNVAVPAVVCYYLFQKFIHNDSRRIVFAAGFGVGFVAVFLSSILTAGSLLAAGREFTVIASVLVLGHVPLMVAEGLVTGSVCVFLKKVKPELLRHTEIIEET